jgi:hypothetical protein
LLVLGVRASALLVTAGSAATSTFATGMVTPETITPTASGGFYVTDAGPPGNTSGTIWSVPAGGGAASPLASTFSLRGGLILLFVVAGVAASVPPSQSTMKTCSVVRTEGRNVGDSTPRDCRSA